MIRVNPFTGELQLVNESGGGGLPTALYDADGSVAASVDDIGNVVFVNGFSTTGNFFGDLDFDGGIITGNCDIDITGCVITGGYADIGTDMEVHGNVYLDGTIFFGIMGGAQINPDGSASFAGVNIIPGGIAALNWEIDEDGSASFAGGSAAIDIDGNGAFGAIATSDLNLGGGSILLHGDGSASFAGGGILFDADGTAQFANGLSVFFGNGEVLLAGIPTGDPFDAGRVYQDATTHALYVSQG